MAVTQQNYTGNGSTTNYSFTFPYLAETDVKVKLNGVTQATSTYTFANATTISMNSAPGNGVAIIIFRDTNNDTKKATFYPGSAIKAEDLNNDFDQILYVAQEVDNNAMSTLGEDPMQGDLPMGNNKLTNLATPTAGTDGANKNYVDNKTWGSASIIDDSIVNADINASAAIAQSKLNIANATTSAAGYQSAADKTKLDGIETGATADQTNAEIRAAVEAASDSNVFTDADHTKLNAAATLTGSETLTNKTLTSPVINDMSGTAVVTSGTSTSDTKTYSAKRAGEIFYGKDTVEEIQSGETWSAADNKVATTSAIDARIIDLVDDVGGFVPIANETSFPNANPDVNNGAGTLVSIKALSSNLTSNGSGVATIANGTVGNSTVTITGLANSTTYAATFGMIVETTSTLNTYTFHRQVPKATEVTTVAGNISNINAVANNESNINSAVSNASNINSAVSNASNINSAVSNASNINTVAGNNSNITTVAGANSNISTVATNITNVNNVGGSIANVNTVASNINSVNSFSDVYRIASSDPTSHLTTGDLAFNTTSNELRVYNGSSWQGGVTATGNLVSKADIGATSGVPGTGSNGQYLKTNGSGTLSWATVAQTTALTETEQTIASNYTISTNKNAMSVGDVTIANGAILTIPENSKYILIS